MTRARPYVAWAMLYGVLALFAYGADFPGDPHRLVPGSDPTLDMWFLTWTPYAITHGLNPLHTTLLNYPVGINTAQNTQMPLLGILAWPVTVILGPISAWNLLAWLAFPLSGISMFAVLKRWQCSPVAAGLGGLIYGFSPYMVGEGHGHLNLLFVPLPPLIVFGIYRLVIVRKNVMRWSLITAGLGVAQLLISSEILTTTAVVVSCAIVVLALIHRRSVLAAARELVVPVAVTTVLVAAVLSYPIWYVVFGPLHFRGPVWGYANPLQSDLLGPFVPSNLQLLYPASLRAVGSKFVGGALSENGTYLGIPLLVGLSYLAARTRRNPWFKFSLGMVMICFVLSLGDRLVIDSRPTRIYLPFHLFSRLPILQDVIASRFSLYEYLFVAIAVGLGVSSLERHRASTPDSSRRLPHWSRALGATALIVAVALSLLPNWPYSTVAISTPRLFAPHPTSSVPKLTGVVLVYPYPLYADDSAMLWQAESLMRFSLLGGYALSGRPHGATILPARLRPVEVESLFAADSTLSYFPMRNPPATTSVAPSSVRRFVANNHVSAIVIDMSQPGAPALSHLVGQTFGAPRELEGFAVWSGLS